MLGGRLQLRETGLLAGEDDDVLVDGVAVLGVGVGANYLPQLLEGALRAGWGGWCGKCSPVIAQIMYALRTYGTELSYADLEVANGDDELASLGVVERNRRVRGCEGRRRRLVIHSA